MEDSAEQLSQLNISQEEKDKLVAEVIRHVLFKTYQNSGCPIKRDELTQIVTRNYHQRLLPALIIKEAVDKLSSVFGLEMRELQRARPISNNHGRSSTQQSSVDVKSYVVMSKLPADVYRKYVEDVNTAHLTGFPFVVISIVQLAGGQILEDNLWNQLARLGLHDTDEYHPALGNIKQAVESLVQQRYLQKGKVNGPDGSTVSYELAERALDGPVNDKIKEYISQVLHSQLVWTTTLPFFLT
ncbi:Melanoma-associated antigen 1 [Linum perenne]